MSDPTLITLTITAFVLSMILILWRPKGSMRPYRLRGSPVRIGNRRCILIRPVYYHRYDKRRCHYDYGNHCNGDCAGKFRIFHLGGRGTCLPCQGIGNPALLVREHSLLPDDLIFLTTMAAS